MSENEIGLHKGSLVRIREKATAGGGGGGAGG
jgi:hypothetical protein